MPYTPDLLGFLSKFGTVTGYFDGQGHYARVLPASQNLFSWNAADRAARPRSRLTSSRTRSGRSASGRSSRCPGGATQPNAGYPNPTDHPFLDNGSLDGDCDPDRRAPWPMRRALLIFAGLVAAVALLVDGHGARAATTATTKSARSSTTPPSWSPARRCASPAPTSAQVAEIDISSDDEIVREDGEPDPGKAVVVLKITDPGFQDFRTDASCLIRPQSLIGEKFVECQPTEPRAPGTRGAA